MLARTTILSCFLAFASLAACDSDDDGAAFAPTAPAGQEEISPAPVPEGFTRATAEVNGVDIAYVTGGEGEALLLLHGWPQNWYEWHRIMPALAEDYTVIVPTLRGVGDSGKPLGTENYTKDVMAEDLHQLVTSLGFETVKIAAHDIGGMVAYAYAADYPAEVERVAFFEAPLPGIDPYWTALLTRDDLLLWHFGLNQTEGAEELVVGNEREYLLRMYTDFSADPEAFSETEVDEYERAYRGLDALRGGFEWYRAFNADAERNAALAPIGVPALAIGGQFSLGGSVLAAVATAVDSAQVTGGTVDGVFEGAGHWVLEERPDEVLREIQLFMAE